MCFCILWWVHSRQVKSAVWAASNSTVMAFTRPREEEGCMQHVGDVAMLSVSLSANTTSRLANHCSLTAMNGILTVMIGILTVLIGILTAVIGILTAMIGILTVMIGILTAVIGILTVIVILTVMMGILTRTLKGTVQDFELFTRCVASWLKTHDHVGS